MKIKYIDAQSPHAEKRTQSHFCPKNNMFFFIVKLFLFYGIYRNNIKLVFLEDSEPIRIDSFFLIHREIPEIYSGFEWQK